MSSNSIFILKPIIDALYEDAKKDREMMEALKNKISMLEKENSELYAENRRLAKVDGMVEIDDAAYAAEASAPATCFTGATCTTLQVEETVENKVVEPVEQEKQVEETLKTVKMIGTLSKKEYMKEYQRNYRKHKKDITMNL